MQQVKQRERAADLANSRMIPLHPPCATSYHLKIHFAGLAGAAPHQRPGAICALAICCPAPVYCSCILLTLFDDFRILQFEFKWPLDAPPADLDRVDAIAQRLRQTLGPI
jgi:hypothetical protein